MLRTSPAWGCGRGERQGEHRFIVERLMVIGIITTVASGSEELGQRKDQTASMLAIGIFLPVSILVA